jgi:hypothetical protein
MRQFSGLVNPPKQRTRGLHRNVAPALTGGVIGHGKCGHIRLLQCILLEIDSNLIYLSIDKFAEASP